MASDPAAVRLRTPGTRAARRPRDGDDPDGPAAGPRDRRRPPAGGHGRRGRHHRRSRRLARRDNERRHVKLVVIGGDAAGMSAAHQARRRMPPDQLQIVAFERGHFTSYSACGIPYWIGDLVGDRDKLIARHPDEHGKAGVEVRLRHEVVGIDLDRREVTAYDLEGGGEVREGFDHLVYATGAVPVTPPWAEVDAAGVFGVQTLDDGEEIHAWLERD